MDKKHVKVKRLKNTLTGEVSEKLVSANEKEPIPKPSEIFELYPNKNNNRKKENPFYSDSDGGRWKILKD